MGSETQKKPTIPGLPAKDPTWIKPTIPGLPAKPTWDEVQKSLDASAPFTVRMSKSAIIKAPANVGLLGKITFAVSDVMIRTISNWEWSGSARYGIHNRHGTHALTEFVGLDPDKITFDIILAVELGVKPMDEIVKLFKYEREGTAVPLTIGEHCYGKYRWNVTGHNAKLKYTDTKGNLTGAVVSVTLQEYLQA